MLGRLIDPPCIIHGAGTAAVSCPPLSRTPRLTRFEHSATCSHPVPWVEIPALSPGHVHHSPHDSSVACTRSCSGPVPQRLLDVLGAAVSHTHPTSSHWQLPTDVHHSMMAQTAVPQSWPHAALVASASTFAAVKHALPKLLNFSFFYEVISSQRQQPVMCQCQ